MNRKQFQSYVRGLLRTSLHSRDPVQKMIAVRTLAVMVLAQQYKTA